MILAALALREEIGEAMPGADGDSGQRLTYLHVQLGTRAILDDPPRHAALDDMVLDALLRDYKADEPADVVGPVAIDYDRAVDLATRYGNPQGVALVEVEEMPRNAAIFAAGAFVERVRS